MAWIQKRGGRWWIGWRHEDREFRKSLKTVEKPVAEEALRKFEATDCLKAANAITGDYIASITGKNVSRNRSTKV
jgi:hypothetical protein